jgi:NADPH:quinone reductase-like Zn-dependent oxidoreductase
MIRILTLFLTASAAGAFAPSQRAMRTTTTSTTTTTPSISSATILSQTAQTSGSTTEYKELTGGKLYTKSETPKVLGGLKMGKRELVVITGASSGLGLNTAINLAKTGRYYVVMAVRDPEKAKRGT